MNGEGLCKGEAVTLFWSLAGRFGLFAAVALFCEID
jgi:hypothetical protein